MILAEHVKVLNRLVHVTVATDVRIQATGKHVYWSVTIPPVAYVCTSLIAAVVLNWDSLLPDDDDSSPMYSCPELIRRATRLLKETDKNTCLTEQR